MKRNFGFGNLLKIVFESFLASVVFHFVGQWLHRHEEQAAAAAAQHAEPSGEAAED